MLKKIAKKKICTGPPPFVQFFFLWGTKGKKIAQGEEGRSNFILFFWQIFSTCEKITQFLEFCKDQGGKI